MAVIERIQDGIPPDRPRKELKKYYYGSEILTGLEIAKREKVTRQSIGYRIKNGLYKVYIEPSAINDFKIISELSDIYGLSEGYLRRLIRSNLVEGVDYRYVDNSRLIIVDYLAFKKFMEEREVKIDD